MYGMFWSYHPILPIIYLLNNQYKSSMNELSKEIMYVKRRINKPNLFLLTLSLRLIFANILLCRWMMETNKWDGNWEIIESSMWSNVCRLIYMKAVSSVQKKIITNNQYISAVVLIPCKQKRQTFQDLNFHTILRIELKGAITYIYSYAAAE